MKLSPKILLKILATLLILMAILVVIAGVIGMHQEAAQEQAAAQLKTNRDYLKEIIEGHMADKIAADITTNVRDKYKNRIPVPLTDADWKFEQDKLAQCINDEQKKFLDSNDPYLNQLADENSTELLTMRFLQTCKVSIAPH